MKKPVLLFLFLLVLNVSVHAGVITYSENGKFGLTDENGVRITKPEYKKLVKLGTSAWIMQYGTKFGIIRDSGQVIVEPKYNSAERVLGKFVKFAKGDKYGIYDEMGFEILPVEYFSIDLLYGGLFVTGKNYRYGISDLNGQVILDNIFDDIYMPEFNKLVLIYNGQVIEIERTTNSGTEIPFDILSLRDESIISISDLAANPLAATGYYGVTATDYILKIISSISPAYEQTIDELMFSQGADTVSVLVKCSWIPKFPFVYAKKYLKNVTNPNNGPLAGIKKTLKNRAKGG